MVDFVGSPVAHGRIRAIDLDEARAIPGVVAVLTAADIPGERLFGAIFHDEEVLAWDEVHHVGQPIVLIAAETRGALRAARKADPDRRRAASRPILTIDDRPSPASTSSGRPAGSHAGTPPGRWPRPSMS